MIFVAVTVPLTLFIDSLVVRLYSDHVANELKTEGDRLGTVINDSRHQHQQRIISTLREISQHSYLLVDENGETVLTTSSKLEERKQIKQAFREQLVKGERVEFEDRSDGEPLYVVGYPIFELDEVHGALVPLRFPATGGRGNCPFSPDDVADCRWCVGLGAASDFRAGRSNGATAPADEGSDADAGQRPF